MLIKKVVLNQLEAGSVSSGMPQTRKKHDTVITTKRKVNVTVQITEKYKQ